MESNVFTSVYDDITHLSPKRSVFDLSHDTTFDCDFGQLIPICAIDCVPGDTHVLDAASLVRTMPLIAPSMNEVNVFTHFFFVPYRLLMGESSLSTDEFPEDIVDYEYENNDKLWETFITGGNKGNGKYHGEFVTLPQWNRNDSDVAYPANTDWKGIHSLWDYFGNPITSANLPLTCHSFRKRAYNLIWNEYYRDENVMGRRHIDNNFIALRCFKKDYFTSALPSQVRGTVPAIPVTLVGSAPVIYQNTTIPVSVGAKASIVHNRAYAVNQEGTTKDWQGSVVQANLSGSTIGNQFVDGTVYYRYPLQISTPNGSVALDGVDVGSMFGVNELRETLATQAWLERNMRCGVRYVEFLRAHFNEAPTDATLQRPEFIGGTVNALAINEVLQSSASAEGSTPQGNLAGKGISVGGDFVGEYDVKEFGVIIGLFSIMPKAYYQQGFDRNFLRNEKFDFYFPEFSNLSEESIEMREIYVPSDGEVTVDDMTEIFGYQGNFNEMRSIPSRVTGSVRFGQPLDYWNNARFFGSAPHLNKEFLEVDGTREDLKRIFAVNEGECAFICHVHNNIKAVRPLPIEPIPNTFGF
ncbi:major capsid protein [Capybara microvirus Cap1_SP_108]|nr:major capsid protein [Capybara microvirus Cap1_SP_108]